MRLALAPLVLTISLSLFQAALNSPTHPSTLAERHSIVKRLAKDGQTFTHHDVASVMYEKQPNLFHRISKRDLKSVSDDQTAQRIRLDLSSGSKLHLNLQKRSLFRPDTLFIDNTHQGLVKRATQPEDCYATGSVETDGTPDGFVSVATCSGLHGTATSNGIEYYIHPVDHADGEHHVHVLSRRASDNDTIPEMVPFDGMPNIKDVLHRYKRSLAPNVDNDTIPEMVAFDGMSNLKDVLHRHKQSSASNADNDTVPEMVASDGIPGKEQAINRYKRASTVTAETYKTATSFVIEMAVFVDANYWIRLQEIAPGREDEYVLIAMAATNALFADKGKVGYDASIKIKLYQNWIMDPEGYVFEQDIFENLATYCKYTRDIYQYDMHFLFTGVTRQQGPAVGVAYMSGACTKTRCANTYATAYNRFGLIAHEIGHNLGFKHHGAAKCPPEIKNQGGSFMGGRLRDFSACNKWELQDFFSRGKGQCLFEETRGVTTDDEYVNLPKILPGQYNNPDEGCRFSYGKSYKLFRPFDFRGDGECAARMCINTNESSPEYLRIRREYALVGYTCDDEMFCDGTTCSSWDKPGIGWSPSLLRQNKGENHWSEWSPEWSPCSSSCGKGVQLKTRRCILSSGPFLSPYCRGSNTQVQSCNEEPCHGDVIPDDAQKQINGDEICQRFYDNDVSLSVEPGSTYLAESKPAWVRDQANRYLTTKTCLLMCTRLPSRFNYIDSIYPDGTPCTESEKSPHKRKRFDIDLRCVQGACTEMSDCPGNEQKDACGVCGGDPTRCVDVTLDQSDDVPEGERKVLAVLPAGSRSIDINMAWWQNKNVRLEVWDSHGEKIFGKNGLFGKIRYKGDSFVTFANTTWTYDHAGYVRSDGPTDHDLVVKAIRQSKPITKIHVTYLTPDMV